MTKFTNHVSALALAAALPAALPLVAHAQEEEQARPRDVITVTAQRVTQDLQDTPVAVTALDTELLERRQVEDVTDLNFNVPNLTLSTGTGTANSARIYLRGIGEDESRGAVDPAVGIYVDGVYLGRTVGALMDVVDLESIEVLRGPQGTLYGRSTNGGAIKLASVEPQFENTLELGTTVGNEGRFDARGIANFAISDNTAFRVAALHRQRDDIFSIQPNGTLAGNAREIGQWDVFSYRLQGLHRFNSGWELKVSYDETQDDSDPVPASFAAPIDADGDLFTIAPAPGVNCSVFASGFFALLAPTGCFTGYENEIETRGASVEVTGTLAGHTFTSITAYREMEDDLNTQVTFPYSQATGQEQFSQEVTLASQNSGPLNYVAGVYYFEEDVDLDVRFIFPFDINTSTNSFAVFGQAFYDVTERFTLTAGLRYTDEEKDLDSTALASGLGRQETAEFEFLSYTLIADYDISDDVMVFASARTGFKGGGWSPDCFSPTSCFERVDEETVETFELGLRSAFANGVIFNATGFFNTYEDLQLSGTTTPGGTFTRFNVDEVETWGLEIESSWQATDNLQFFANLGFLDGEYSSLTPNQAFAITSGGQSIQCPAGTAAPAPNQAQVDCALGLELKNAPAYKGLVGATWQGNIWGGVVTATGDIGFEDDSWTLVANSPASAQTDIGAIINARIGYEPQNARWSIALWGKNLGDEQYYRAASANTVYPSDPLTFGVDVDVRF
ncbi:TonB-dependent receptor [Marinicauda algicola]|nr:TonB-dependent receptor [Marinicauda algicola]